MILNSPRLIPALCSRYCGMVLYLSNSARHAVASSGGTTPVTGFHSTIDRPDSVSRVAPPTTTVANIRAATASSHSRTARRRVSVDGARLVMGSFVWDHSFAVSVDVKLPQEVAASSQRTFHSNNHTRRMSLPMFLRLRRLHANIRQGLANFAVVIRAPRTISSRDRSRN